jgi:hypothetical protein
MIIDLNVKVTELQKQLDVKNIRWIWFNDTPMEWTLTRF